MNFTLIIHIDCYFYDVRVGNYILDARQLPRTVQIPGRDVDNGSLQQHFEAAVTDRLGGHVAIHRVHYQFDHPLEGYQILNDDFLNLTLWRFLEGRQINNPLNAQAFQLYVFYH